jgi:streptomycin 6-kinase
MIGIDEAAERWDLADITEIADTHGSLVFRARKSGQQFVVKLLKPRGMGELAGMDYLAWRDGHGAVRLLERQANACLLEDAGLRNLEQVRQSAGEVAATETFAELLQKLQAPSPHPVPQGLVSLERHFAALLDPPSGIPSEHAADLTWATNIARDLLSRQTNVMPLHGDLHHENILSDATGRWRVIDPHGLIGDPAYDVANFFGNPLGRPDITCDQGRIRLLAVRLARALGRTEDVILRFAAAHAALSACWSISDPVSDEDRQDALDRLTFLTIIKAMLDSNHP